MNKLSGANWIWLPSQRTIPNSFMLFKKIFSAHRCSDATCYIFADSRYKLYINGHRIGFGPAPCDPRHQEADYYDVSQYITEGDNIITVQALFYGHGEGTWVTGRPGLIFKLDLNTSDGKKYTIVTDETWQVKIDRSHKNGNYKRWYLRSLQEEQDLRLWDDEWLCNNDVSGCVPARIYGTNSELPSLYVAYPEYLCDAMNVGSAENASLTLRSMPLLIEKTVTANRHLAPIKIKWNRDPNDWFEYRQDGAYTISGECSYENSDPISEHEGILLTYVFREQCVGFPVIELEADEGTSVEVIVQESHDESKPALLDTYFYNWSRFICREGYNRFEAFDYESVKYLQLHIYGGRAAVKKVSVLRRVYDWANPAIYRTDEPKVQKVFDACLNTLYNNSLEIIADGMGRERQQYMGDLGHILNAHRYVFGETKMPERVLRSFSYGQTFDGYYLDCWPAYDRCNRISQRILGLTPWGPIIDHGVQFAIECWDQYMYTGNIDLLRELAPGLIQFCNYLDRLRNGASTLPVENLGIEYIWIDHECYHSQKHKECAFNLYVIGMLKCAIIPMMRELNIDEPQVNRLLEILTDGVVHKFWDGETFVANLPWHQEEGGKWYCDRSLSSAILFDIMPEGNKKSAEILASRPQNLGISYPANAYWRNKALLRSGYAETFFDEVKTIWFSMTSVQKNNTMQEFWTVQEDATYELCHVSVSPLHLIYTDILGLQITEAGCKKVAIAPRNDFAVDLSFRCYIFNGYIDYKKTGKKVTISLSPNLQTDKNNNTLIRRIS